MSKSDLLVMQEMCKANEDIACFPDFVEIKTVKAGIHVTMGAPREALQKLMSNDYALILYMVNKKQFFDRKKRPDEHISKEDADNFAMSFVVWALHDPQAKAYLEAGCTTYQLLEKYKNRPYIDTANPSNQ